MSHRAEPNPIGAAVRAFRLTAAALDPQLERRLAPLLEADDLAAWLRAELPLRMGSPFDHLGLTVQREAGADETSGAARRADEPGAIGARAATTRRSSIEEGGSRKTQPALDGSTVNSAKASDVDPGPANRTDPGSKAGPQLSNGRDLFAPSAPRSPRAGLAAMAQTLARGIAPSTRTSGPDTQVTAPSGPHRDSSPSGPPERVSAESPDLTVPDAKTAVSPPAGGGLGLQSVPDPQTHRLAFQAPLALLEVLVERLTQDSDRSVGDLPAQPLPFRLADAGERSAKGDRCPNPPEPSLSPGAASATSAPDEPTGPLSSLTRELMGGYRRGSGSGGSTANLVETDCVDAKRHRQSLGAPAASASRRDRSNEDSHQRAHRSGGPDGDTHQTVNRSNETGHQTPKRFDAPRLNEDSHPKRSIRSNEHGHQRAHRLEGDSHQRVHRDPVPLFPRNREPANPNAARASGAENRSPSVDRLHGDGAALYAESAGADRGRRGHPEHPTPNSETGPFSLGPEPTANPAASIHPREPFAHPATRAHPLDPHEIADQLNDILIEQARRHGLDIH
ncbi:hypothetical protein SCOR_07700 [Sulfidibacter corallicola]|uniref:Uncharacterized protein n=1 Tax=Sulfidibacter corallicola TaxID=2818388 RepID=A0A8A4TP79_SULCO|nr:hypothetical protein [Sulfidibacter corallicola]QTD51353.1 hypothetical protein J3U87_02695 [Sulfidibacter corallicola]